ncbi:hypothetical protein RvY_08639 [Ramazzottius varieornatus]|uniref:Uncharacterized protein n=1 Tax=Ramazzottius varieornatus TaxID=947166 RepID=A0A1D1V8U1_RAMVA|nr:hypothetical protein RvY_08639 [Ramazzottius varieornatus]
MESTCATLTGQFWSCQSTLQAVQQRYQASLRKADVGCSTFDGSGLLVDELKRGAHRASELLSTLEQDTKIFADLVSIIEALEASQEKNVLKLMELQQENGDLKEEVNTLRGRLTTAEQSVVQLETEKAQLEFLQTLPSHDRRSGHSSTDVDKILETPMDKIAVADRPIPLSLLNSGRRGSAEVRRRVLPFRIRDSEERETKSPGIPPTALNYTVLNGSIDGEDLDELGDKLSWYESIMRQLQEILGAELDDPDITYHEESNKIVERAKRMIEYREMIPAYEQKIDELQKKNAQLLRTQDAVRKSIKENINLSSHSQPESRDSSSTRLLSTSNLCNPSINLPSNSFRRKNSR